MRRAFISLALYLTLVPPLAAQSLEIGGIAVKLGEPLTDALTHLKAAYNPQFIKEAWRGAPPQWWIMTNNGDDRLGEIRATDGVVNYIEAKYDTSDEYELDQVYIRALTDVGRLGGTVCTTTPTIYPASSDLPQGSVKIDTKCGLYTLELHLPSKLRLRQSNSAPNVGGSIYVRLAVP